MARGRERGSNGRRNSLRIRACLVAGVSGTRPRAAVPRKRPGDNRVLLGGRSGRLPVRGRAARDRCRRTGPPVAPGLRVSPPQLIFEPGKVRKVHDWPSVWFWPNHLSVNPEVEFGGMDGVLRMSRPGENVPSSIAPCTGWRLTRLDASWEYGAPHRVSSESTCFRPLDWALPWHGMTVASMTRPSLQIIDFSGGRRLVEKGGARDRLFASLACFVSLLAGLGA